jgi:hypothetical protein
MAKFWRVPSFKDAPPHSTAFEIPIVETSSKENFIGALGKMVNCNLKAI